MFTPYPPNAQLHLDRQRRVQMVWLGFLLALTMLIGVMMLRGGPNWSNLGWLLYIAGVVLIVTNPRYGLYLVVLFTLCGDSLVWAWYPFTKNLSSEESLLFLSPSLKVSPLETYLAFITMMVLIQGALRRKLNLRLGPLGMPVGFFGFMLVFGLVYGIVGHGNLTIALWEVRSMLYLVLMYFLVVNLVDDRRQINIMMWCIVLGIVVKGLSALFFLFAILGGDLGGREAIMEHGASIHMDLLFVLTLTVFLYRTRLTKRMLLPLLAAPTAIAYLANQRRASFVSLAIALMLMAVALYRHSRRAFWAIVPATAVMGMLYIAATWNASGVLALPARGLKSVIAPNARDEASNEYRVVENVNTNFTIHQKALTGVGFGQKFFVIVPLPDISFFVWYEYITHNSIMWVWMQTGFFGFMSLLIMVGSTIMIGFHAYDRMPPGDEKAIGLTALLYVVMHFVYAYVDMSWENQSMILVGASIGIIGSLQWVMSRPIPAPRRRYRWQTLQPVQPVLLEDNE